MFFNGASLHAIALCAFAVLGSVSAVPSPTDYPEVIPGPGMPSLVSLGLTTKDLYESSASLGKREQLPGFGGSCDSRLGQVHSYEAQACINYLRSLGTQMCGVAGDSIVFCRSGNALVTGTNVSGTPTASSYCSDVATGGQHVIDNCTYRTNGLVCGYDAANGNGFLMVTIKRA